MATLQIIGLLLGFLGAVALIIPFFKTSKQIEEESAMCLGYNPHAMKSAKFNKHCGVTGLVFIAISFALQLLSYL